MHFIPSDVWLKEAVAFRYGDSPTAEIDTVVHWEVATEMKRMKKTVNMWKVKKVRMGQI